MCAISGFLSLKLNKSHLQQMVKVLSHRGPDHNDFFYDENIGIGLGHNRLSIIDISENANQPFYSQSNRYVMVFNGEVYNFQEIKTKYQIQTKTSSDTEVILELFAKKGISFVNELNGMFAIAIWDKNEEKLHLFRDRIGIKPLYYFYQEGIFAFASEIKALVNILKDQVSINQNILQNILQFGFSTENDTIYNEINQLPAGQYLTIDKALNIQSNSYWKLENQLNNEVINDEKRAKKELNEKLVNSVQKRMIADVPLGTFLSGGIDSSTVTAIAQSLSNQPINTFSIGFKDSKHDESKFAKEVAKHLGTNHHEFILTEKDALQQVDKLLDIYDQPFADSSAIPTLLVSEMAKKHVKVALSGDGGDEQFLGYGMYQWANRMNKPIIWNNRKLIHFGLATFGNQRMKRASKVFNSPQKQSLKSHIFSQEQYFFSEKEVNRLLKTKKAQNRITENWELDRKLNPMEYQAFYDMKHYLPDDLLVKVDRASMHHALEVRVPLLDHEVVEYSLNISPELKFNNGCSKYLLKQVLYDYVPKNLFDRPKWGFSIPLAKWLKTDLKHLIDTYLSVEKVEETNIFQPKIVSQLVKKYLDGEDYLYNRVWILTLIQKFLLNHHA